MSLFILEREFDLSYFLNFFSCKGAHAFTVTSSENKIGSFREHRDNENKVVVKTNKTGANPREPIIQTLYLTD